MIKAEKINLPVLKHFVLLQRSNIKCGTETAGKSRRPFLYLHINKRQANRLAVCVTSNGRKDEHLSPEQHRKPFLFNVLTSNAMNTQQAMTAGKTAIENLRGSILSERKSIAQNIIDSTHCALIFYYDENSNLRTYSVCEDGYETMQLQMLSSAACIARNAVEDVIDNL